MGEVVKFGRWCGKTLEWDVISEDEYKKLLFCRTCVRNTSYNNPWINNYDRTWLNDDFLKEAFNEKERISIVNAKHTEQKESSKDNIFLLSRWELGSWVKNNGMGGRDSAITRTMGVKAHPTIIYSDGKTLEKSHYDTVHIYPALYLKKNVE